MHSCRAPRALALLLATVTPLGCAAPSRGAVVRSPGEPPVVALPDSPAGTAVCARSSAPDDPPAALVAPEPLDAPGQAVARGPDPMDRFVFGDPQQCAQVSGILHACCVPLVDGTRGCFPINPRPLYADRFRRGPVGCSGMLSPHSYGCCVERPDRTGACWVCDSLEMRTRRGPPAAPLVDPVLADVAALALGDSQSCARMRNGEVRCWGATYVRGAGTTPACGFDVVPVPVRELYGATQIAFGSATLCARMSNGTVRCAADHGAMLGDGTPRNTYAFTTLPGLRDIAEVAVGEYVVCVRTAAGAVSCWGDARSGVTGEPRDESDRRPRAIAGVAGAVQLVTGAHHACVLSRDGVVRCWGDDGRGQLGTGIARGRCPDRALNARCPAPVTEVFTGAVQVVAGSAHTCARRADGSVWCWGAGELGEIGDGAEVDRAAPTRVEGLGCVTQLAAGLSHTCARVADGTVWCWGFDLAGRAVPGPSSEACHGGASQFRCRRRPTRVDGLAEVREVAVGGTHTCARVAGGEVRCWGEYAYGQLGI